MLMVQNWDQNERNGLQKGECNSRIVAIQAKGFVHGYWPKLVFPVQNQE